MAELDFDELDRAVNSLMSKAPVSVPAKQDDDVTTVDLSSSGGMLAEPLASNDLPVVPAANRTPVTPPPLKSPEAEVTQPTSLPSQAVKPSHGRFMDMIRPSAAKGTEKLTAPSVRPSREAKVIEPRSSGLIADIVKKPVPQSSETPLGGEAVEPVPDEVPKTESAPSDATSPEVPTTAARTSTGNDFSAFLPDAKVDKRPLGQPVSSTPAIDTTASAEPEGNSAPEEYDQQLVAIESGNIATVTPAPVSKATPKDPSDATVVQAETDLDPSASAPEPSVVSPEPKATGSTSIAQQYQEQPSSSDQSNGAIYDTSTYHQPLSHPAKKSSGWLWVVLIVIIILIGAGAGAYLYLNNI